MKKSLLAVDVGNTHTTIGLFDGALLAGRWRLATRITRTSDELWAALTHLLRLSDFDPGNIERFSIASVVPEMTQAYARMARERFCKEPFIVSSENVRSLSIDYDPPESVGADRLCGAVAGFHLVGGPLVVVDLGTATVFDVVTAEGVYKGGVIAPGLMTANEALHGAAALLPKVELRFPNRVIGRSTEQAIQSGILFGAVELIDGLVERIAREMVERPRVVATGGFAELLKRESRTITHVEPDLVLLGIRLITEQAK